VSETSAAPTATRTQEDEDLRLPVLEALRELLKSGRDDEVLELVAKLVARNSELEKRLAEIAARRHHGEGISSQQLDLFLKALAANPSTTLAEADKRLKDAAPIPPKKQEEETKPKQPAIRRPPPPTLRRVENLLRVPDAERPCPICGAPRTCIGHEITQVIDLIPAEVIVRLDKREKLACEPCEGELVRAPMGDKVVGAGYYGSTLVAHLIVGKYRDGLPLYRQGEQLERLGLRMPSSSMGDQITWGTDLLQPLWRHSIDRLLSSKVMHVDGTGLPVRDRDAEGGMKLGSLWGYVGDAETALYLYTSTGKKRGQRPGEIGPEDLLAHRSGYVVADASNLFDLSFKRSGLIEVGCNMHSRRYFTKALDAGDHRAALPIAAYKKLYDIEEEIQALRPDEKRAIRQERSKPIYDEIISWSSTYKAVEPPKSPLGVAIRYQLNHQQALKRYLEDGILPIDNGIVERLHRRPAVGRRNYLFAGSDAGGDRAAIAYSILGTCELADVDPVAYLADILPRLARDGVVIAELPAMMPAAWKAARAAPNLSPAPQ
jgi:transposase